MPYPSSMVEPMRKELTRLGVDELTTPDEVDAAFDAAQEGSLLLVINSVCGCAAGSARPAVARALKAEPTPDRAVTVFAGQDLEATDHVRETYLPGIPPSSPFMALFREGQPVYVVERKHIEGREAISIAEDLVGAFEAYCTDEALPSDAPNRPDLGPSPNTDGPSSTFQSIR
ncbi:BrxA/BrxB family bacilliredoxin [Salinibacter altiplanensis]|uniref:BrxA/BrxB family bacilliredoxin n=1 Tax=Salinibacter altiplanensis TaxID=1803181 RepID=UPI000C9F8935|nr:BrxA/BrxB family bacilliredoxin [Salinibacter altiplanensis]